MAYKLRDDIVLEKIDNIYIFVALRSAWKDCPFAMHTAPSFAFMWEEMKKGKREDEIIELLQTERNMDCALAHKNYRFFIEQCIKLHYINEEAES